MGNRKLFPTLLGQLIVAIIFIVLFLFMRSGRDEKLAEMREIWDNGIETTGTLTKGKQSLFDTGRTVWQIRTGLEYEAEGKSYRSDCVVFKSDFKALDKDKDDKAEVVVCYDAKDPSRAATGQAVEAAAKTNKFMKIALWIWIVLAGIELLCLPVARKMDRES